MILFIPLILALFFLSIAVIAGSGTPDRNFVPKRANAPRVPTHYLDTTIGQIRRVDNGLIEKPNKPGDVYP